VSGEDFVDGSLCGADFVHRIVVAVNRAKDYRDVWIKLVAVLKKKKQGVVVDGDDNIMLPAPGLVFEKGVKVSVVSFVAEVL
jgi:hypothetical protein